MKHFLYALLFVVAGIVESAVLEAQTDSLSHTKAPSQQTKSYQSEAVHVQAERARSAVSDQQLTQHDLKLLPLSSSQDVLRLVPGLILAQHAGGGKAEQIFLRGFDCDHGTDVSISVDDNPVNMVSHGHGQGYADLHFVIPESIERIDVLKGPYFAAYGDQATAGVVRIRTADTLKENIAKAEAGMFQTYRAMTLVGTSLGRASIYAGAEALMSRGYFDASQDFRRFNGMLKLYDVLSDQWTVRSSFFAFSSKWNASGQIPERAVREGLISDFGSIDSLEGGNSSRQTLSCQLQSSGAHPWTINAGITRYDFQLFSNFSFFALDSVHGDMIEQTDRRSIAYLSASSHEATSIVGLPGSLSFGSSLRSDQIQTALYHDQERVRLGTTVNAGIQQTNAALYAEQKLFIDDCTLSLALRADYFNFQVRDELHDAQRAEQALLLSPKFNASYDLSDQISLYFNSGFGFHSNDARAVVQDTSGHLIPRAFGAECGLRVHRSNLSFSAALWMLDLQSELVWSGDEGTTEQSGRTRRYGIDADLRYSFSSTWNAGLDVCTAHGRYRDEAEGQNFIPLAPSLTLSAYCQYSGKDYSLALRCRHIDSRPANEDNSLVAEGYTVADFNATLSLSSSVELSVECRNILNTAWKEAQFDTTSRLQSEAQPVADIHFTEGTPRNAKLGVTLHF